MSDIFTNEITKKKFIKFVWPSILMMIVIALYFGMDSILVANMVGEKALAALSIAYPVQGFMWGISVMLASGSSAIVAIKMGEGKMDEANEKFSLVCIVSVISGCIFTAVTLIFLPEIVGVLGATDILWDYCYDFLKILAWGVPAAFLGVIFEYFIRVDGSPGFTLFLYIMGGVAHLTFAVILMGPLDMGILGTAYANVAGHIMVMVVGGCYFVFGKTRLKFKKFRVDFRFIGHCFLNGSSEMVTESSAGITTFFFNLVVIKLVGEIGVAAVSIVMNFHYLVISIYLGYIMGIAPLISYFYGAKDFSKVNQIIRYSKWFIAVTSIVSAIGCLGLGQFIVMLYERPGSELYELAVTGTKLLSFALLIGGVNIFASGFFTAYGNGVISAIISASRALIMVIIGMYLLSWIMGMTGIWYTLTFAEIMTLGLTYAMLKKYKDRYKYNFGIIGL